MKFYQQCLGGELEMQTFAEAKVPGPPGSENRVIHARLHSGAAMLMAALEYVKTNKSGRTEIWICSDLRATDWNPDDGRWASARDGFQALDGVKFFLLSYDEPARDNLAVSVTNVRQRGIGDEQELTFDVKLTREGDASARINVPGEFHVNGVRSVVNVEMTGNEFLLKGHRVPLDAESTGGWGRIDIPADENPLDNSTYFVFARPPAPVRWPATIATTRNMRMLEATLQV